MHPKNYRRKERLDKRARQIAAAEARRYDLDQTTVWDVAYHSYNRGYRAAMADARKVLKDTPQTYIAQYESIRLFLRPLR